MKSINRLKREHETVNKMISLYCRSHHSPPPGHLCPDCQSLADYAHRRVERCPLRSTLQVGMNKPTCANCPVHCYQPDRRAEIRTVMRYSGPRMLLYHPILAVLHLIDGCCKPPVR